jgi:hypothetical protein
MTVHPADRSLDALLDRVEQTADHGFAATYAAIDARVHPLTQSKHSKSVPWGIACGLGGSRLPPQIGQ